MIELPDIMIIIIPLIVGIPTGYVIGFYLIRAIYIERLQFLAKELLNSIELPNLHSLELLEKLKQAIDYGEPIKYGGIVVSFVAAIVAAILGINLEILSFELRILLALAAMITGTFGGAIWGNGVANMMTHDVLLEVSMKYTTLNDAIKESLEQIKKKHCGYVFKWLFKKG